MAIVDDGDDGIRLPNVDSMLEANIESTSSPGKRSIVPGRAITTAGRLVRGMSMQKQQYQGQSRQPLPSY